MKKVYYSHCMTIYNTPQEKKDIALLETLGYKVVNPNTPKYAEEYKKYRSMVWCDLANTCDVLAFRALPDGKNSSDVCAEIESSWPNLRIVFRY